MNGKRQITKKAGKLDSWTAGLQAACSQDDGRHEGGGMRNKEGEKAKSEHGRNVSTS
jgi:hypothetical protein